MITPRRYADVPITSGDRDGEIRFNNFHLLLAVLCHTEYCTVGDRSFTSGLFFLRFTINEADMMFECE